MEKCNEVELLPENTFWSWASSCFSTLLQQNESQGFNFIDTNLFFEDHVFRFDLTDKLNNGLISSTIDNKNQLAILLPDNNPVRPIMLLATSLLVQWFNCARNSQRSQNIMFFGSPSILRTYFNNIHIKFGKLKIPISKLLPQIRVDGHGLEKEENVGVWEAHIPKVICNYSPTDSISLLEIYKPDWIVIDCGNRAKEISSLKSILEYCKINETPVIALSQNPLSECIKAFKTNDSLIFSWPQGPKNNEIINTNYKIDSTLLEIYFKSYKDTIIKPIIIKAPYEKELSKAYDLLAKSVSPENGQLVMDACRIGWMYFRTLESLHIPLNIYELESKLFWGMKQVGTLRYAFLDFIEAVDKVNPEIGEYLDQANDNLDKVYSYLQNNEPSIWLALNTLCSNSEIGKDELNMIIFSSNARKQLFSWTLLARFNITEEDLLDRQIVLTCLKEFRRELIEKVSYGEKAEINKNHFQDLSNYSIHPLLVGLPSLASTSKLDALLTRSTLDILIYDYQYEALLNRVNEWGDLFSMSLINNAKVLSKYTCDRSNINLPEMPQYIKVDSETLIVTEQGLKRSISAPPPLIKPINSVDEISLLIQEDDDKDIVGNICDNVDKGISSEKPIDITINKVIELKFEEGNNVLFSPDDLIKVILDGDHLDERYVRSLKEGDRVLFIHGLKRQNLYDLIISRIHKHPAIEVHLALIKRWHEDFYKAVQRERRDYDMTMNELLEELQENGCKISSVQSLRQWLDGSVLCPEDPEDLWRLADALNMDFVMQNYKRINKASHRLRGIHSGLAIKLNNWLIKQAKGIIEEDENMYELIDDELGLTLQDFKDALTILQVKSINEKQGLFYRDSLGKLEKEA